MHPADPLASRLLPPVWFPPGQRFDPSALARMIDADPGVQHAVLRPSAAFRPIPRPRFAVAEGAALADLPIIGAPAARSTGAQGTALTARGSWSLAVWDRAGGAGRYRALLRWPGTGRRLFGFGFGLRPTEGGYAGLRIDILRDADGATVQLRAYTGVGGATRKRAESRLPPLGPGWHWLEVDLSGTQLRLRLAPEEAPASGWLLRAEVPTPLCGAFGPGAFGGAPTQIRRLEFRPGA